MALSLAACAPDDGGGDDFLACQGKCDNAGPLTLSTRWVPVGGSIRAQTGGSDLSVSPSAGVELRERSGGRWIATFTVPGYYTVQSAGGSITIRVADEGLAIELLSPEPGEFVTASESESILVRGRIIDSLGGEIGDAQVAGQSVSLSASGEFEVSLPAAFGINTIEIDASDRAGNQFDVARSFMAAASFSKKPSKTFVQLDNEALAFISEAVEPKLALLLTQVLAELSASTDSIGGADEREVFLDDIQFPGIQGAPGSLNFEIETAEQGVLTAVLRTQGDTIAALNTGDGLFDFRVNVTARDLFAKITIDFSDYQSVGPIVTDLRLGFAPGQESFDIDVVNLPEFIENFFVDDGETRNLIANGMKDVVAPSVSALFASFAGTIGLAFDILGERQEVSLNYSIVNIRTLGQALQIDLAATLPTVAASDGPGAPTRN